MKVYKVLRKNGYQGMLTSAFHLKHIDYSLSEKGKSWLQYELGKKTTPMYGGIFCFLSLEAAEFFKLQYRDRQLVIAEGYGTPLRIKPVTTSRISLACDKITLEEFWKDAKKRKKNCVSAPSGTILLKHFTPTHLV